MAHYKRHRDKSNRPYSDWSYPNLEKGKRDFTRFRNVKRANSANHNRKEWEHDVGTIHYYG